MVLNLLRLRGPMSRADIARITGLHKATASGLLEALLARQLVKEIGTGPSTGGRRPKLVTLNASAGTVIGADLGVDYLLVVMLNLHGQVVWRKRILEAGSANPAEEVERLAHLIEEAVASVPPAPLGLLGIGVAVPGLVEDETGRLLFAPNLGWQDVPVGDLLRRRFDVPVRVENDGNTGALAEVWAGALEGAGHLFFLNVGVGVGAGIIIDGEIYRGARGMAGEFGHTTVDPAGPLCNCGNRGCLETFVSQRALTGLVRRGADTGPTTLSAEAVFQAAERGDPAAIAALARVGEYLGIGIANALHTFDPDVVVIGGPMARGGPSILNAVRRVVEQRAMPSIRSHVRIVVSTLGEDAPAIGAGAMILQEFFRIPGTRAPARPLRSHDDVADAPLLGTRGARHRRSRSSGTGSR
ncbi:MAG: ROK family transcriptional regulator [Limnochordaceae bacterium]|nr:ROK family transcriptional regulator [Limnochordaceae bacterium]